MNEVLGDIPAGRHRGRMEAELRDHLETLRRDLTAAGTPDAQARAEALRLMGEPERLREEYKAAWRRSLPGRLNELSWTLRTWAVGFMLMLGVHLLLKLALVWVVNTALSLPGDSAESWVRLLRGTLGELRDSLLFWSVLPMASTLTAGACYLSRRFQFSRRPARRIGAGLSLYWVFIAALNAWWYAMVHPHRPFWEAVGRHFYFGAGYYALTFTFCILLRTAFGYVVKSHADRRPYAD